jgi:hypothetical protein
MPLTVGETDTFADGPGAPCDSLSERCPDPIANTMTTKTTVPSIALARIYPSCDPPALTADPAATLDVERTECAWRW